MDASIAAAWFLEETQSAFAADLLNRDHDLIAPDLVAAEVGSALVRAFRRNLISSEEASNGLSAIVTGLMTLHATAPLLVDASAIACRRRCSICPGYRFILQSALLSIRSSALPRSPGRSCSLR